MSFSGFESDTLRFMAELAQHNDREWFAQNRQRYERVLLERQRAFVDAVGVAFREIDPRVQCVPAVNRSIFRINRDTRFSRDKSPYKTYSDLFFWIGEDRRSSPGYFMRITAEEIWVGCGAHRLSSEQLANLRAAIVAPASGEALERIVGGLEADGYEIGERGLKRVPAGFSADAPRADLLRLTAVHAIQRTAPPKEFEGAEFTQWCMERFVRCKPLVDWLVDHIG